MIARLCAGLLLCAGLAAATALPAVGQKAGPGSCPIPEHLMLREIALPRARAQIAQTGKLVILTLGGTSTSAALLADPAATYPALLQAKLAAAVPEKAISVVNRAIPQPGPSTMPPDIAATIAQTSASLVIWASGSREAARSVDVDEYVATLQKGIAEVRRAGADVILLDLQYAPSIARITNSGPYRDALYGAAMANDVPVLHRYDLMVAWSDGGVIDLDAPDGEGRKKAARRLFDCLSSALAPGIARAVQ